MKTINLAALQHFVENQSEVRNTIFSLSQEQAAELLKELVLADYGRFTVEQLAADTDWSADTLDEISNRALAMKLAEVNEEGMFSSKL